VAEKRLVLSDSSPLIALAAAGGFGLLRDFFGDISITAEVRGELLAGATRPGATELRRGLALAVIVQAHARPLSRTARHSDAIHSPRSLAESLFG